MLNFKSLSIISSLLIVFAIPFASAQGNNKVDLELFYGQGCPHCSKMIGFLNEIKEIYPNININEHEIYFDSKNVALFQNLINAYEESIDAVPTVFIGDKVFVGFSNKIGEQMINEIKLCTQTYCPSPLARLKPEIKKESYVPDQNSKEINDNEKIPTPINAAQNNEETFDNNAEDLKDLKSYEEEDSNISNMVTIPAVISAAVVDAINPCAFAVLIILITTILASGNRLRALFAGLSFSTSIFISYFLMGIGLYTAIQASGLTHNFYLIIAILAIVIGLFNLKDYLWYGKFFVMEVPISWRPKLKLIINSVTSVPGAFFTGFIISLFLLPCTSGPYIVILGLLAHATTKSYAIMLLAFYNLIFISPMIIITTAVYFGFTDTQKAEEWRTKNIKILHLIAGIIILALGTIMLSSIFLGYI
ncbi:cytochrome c biogenesis protein [Candidatus Peregrinibacteria bacterium]|nr:cytochrome c biogenesis protein [Candidatus Peregrinibacteria bacterium]